MISQSWASAPRWCGRASARRSSTRSSTFIVGLRANVETEREGLDITEHTERACNM
jgi:Amt family ammonium transporter